LEHLVKVAATGELAVAHQYGLHLIVNQCSVGRGTPDLLAADSLTKKQKANRQQA